MFAGNYQFSRFQVYLVVFGMEISRITVQPDICHGKPCIRGMRYPVSLVLELLAAGMSPADILADYPALEAADIRACLAYAARLSDLKTLPYAAL